MNIDSLYNSSTLILSLFIFIFIIYVIIAVLTYVRLSFDIIVNLAKIVDLSHIYLYLHRKINGKRKYVLSICKTTVTFNLLKYYDSK